MLRPQITLLPGGNTQAVTGSISQSHVHRAAHRVRHRQARPHPSVDTPAQQHRPPRQHTTPPHPPYHTVSNVVTCKHWDSIPPLQPFVPSLSYGPCWTGGGVQRAAGVGVASPSWQVTPCVIFKPFPHLLNEAVRSDSL